MKLLLTILLAFLNSFIFCQTDRDLTSLQQEVVAKIRTAEDPKILLESYSREKENFEEWKYTDLGAQRFFIYWADDLNRYGLKDEALEILVDLENNGKVHNPWLWDQLLAVYTDLQKEEKAVEYARRSLAEFTKSQDSLSIGVAYINLSDLYMNRDMPNEALLAVTNARQFLKDTVDMATVYHNTGVIYGMLKEFEFGEKNLRIALSQDESFVKKDSASNLYPELVVYDYFELGNLYRKKGDFKKALELYDSALLWKREKTEKSLVLKIYRNSYTVCENLSEYRKGFESSLKYTALKDSIFSQERIERLANLELKNHLLHLKREEEQVLNRKQIIQNSAVLFIILSAVILIFYIKRYNINPKVLGSIIFLTILLFFEFVLVVLEPTIAKISGSTPIIILMCNFIVALIFLPVHRRLETWFEKKVLNRAVTNA